MIKIELETKETKELEKAVAQELKQAKIEHSKAMEILQREDTKEHDSGEGTCNNPECKCKNSKNV